MNRHASALKGLVLGVALLLFGTALAQSFPPQGSGGSSSSSTAEWTTYTPTCSWSTNTTVEAAYRVVNGTSMDIHFHLTLSGAPDTAALTFEMPPGWENDDDVTGSQRTQYFNSMGSFLDGALTYQCSVRNNTGDKDQLRVYWWDPSVGAYLEFGGNVTQASPRTWGSGDNLWISITNIPVVAE